MSHSHSHILVIDSSASGSSSVSRLLVADTVKRLHEVLPKATVTHRDVGNNLIPHLTTDTVAGVRAVAATASELTTQEGAAPPTPKSAINFDAILQANLAKVFGEHDPARRIQVIRELYHENAELHEPGRSVQGHEAISQAVTELLASLPSDFVFRAIRPALGLSKIGRLQWRAGPQDGPAAVTGTDVAHVEDGRIRSLYVFLDQAGA